MRLTPKAVIFDMDGLMLDTERLAMQAVKTAASRFDVVVTDDIIKKLIGLNEDDAYLLLKNELNLNVGIEEMGKAYYEDYLSSLEREGIALKKGLIDLLDFLKTENIHRAVATMTNTDLAAMKLTKSGIMDHFPVLIGRDQVSKGKPAPDVYQKALSVLDINAEQCLALEDSDHGAQAAISAGIPVIVVPDLKQPSDKIREQAHAVLPSLVEVRSHLVG